LSIDGPGGGADVLCVATRSRTLLVLVLLLTAIVLGATAGPARSGAQRETVLRSLNHELVSAINTFRLAHGLPALHVSRHLNAAARQHSEEMGADGYFDHPSADGTAFWKRIQHYYPIAHYTYWTAGENLLYQAPTVDATSALQMWIASPEHLKNLKDKSWTDLGVSAVHVIAAGGVYGGSDVTIITTDFGARH
jgi:uncharacterized protein YkwD